MVLNEMQVCTLTDPLLAALSNKVRVLGDLLGTKGTIPVLNFMSELNPGSKMARKVLTLRRSACSFIVRSECRLWPFAVNEVA